MQRPFNADTPVFGGGSSGFNSISIRDWIAVMAMQGIVSARELSELKGPVAQGHITETAYGLADAMIKASASIPASA